MPKLNAPLFAFRASGQIAKALVYFGWKGLRLVRSYVVPANPKTAKQVAHRAYLTAAVLAIHTAQALAAKPLRESDNVAYAALASLHKTPRTWFNEIVRQWLLQKVDSLEPCIWRYGSPIPAVDSITWKIWNTPEAGAVTNVNIHYGTSKTALIHTVAATPAQMEAGKPIPGLTTGVKYYIQVRPTLPIGFIGANSGIYYGVPD